MINRYTIFGNPVEHSLSPRIHQLFAEQSQRRGEYTTTLSTEDTFAKDVKSFQQAGGLGCNITVPFKAQAFELCDTVTEAAKVAGACNTIKFHADGKLVGHNTDGSGLLQDLKVGIGFEPAGKNLLIVGAGGATRGVLHPLLAEQPARLLIVNRTTERAEQLATEFADYGNIEALGFEQLANLNDAFDLVINATSAGLQGETAAVPGSIFSSSTCAYDFSYSRDVNKPDTAFLALAKSHNCNNTNDGMGMLLEQAADAFFIWEDIRPKTRLIGPQVLAS